MIQKVKSYIPRELINLYHLINSFAACIFYGYPAKNLEVVGVTGTDGKTTTSTIIYHILKSDGRKVALISTVAAYIGNEKIDVGLHTTTPNPWKLQKLIKIIADKGYKYLILEATSHGIDQYRLFGTNIKKVVITNITKEHLDYHKTYDNYLAAKAKLTKNTDLVILPDDKKLLKKLKPLIKSKSVQILQFENESKAVQRCITDKFTESFNQTNAHFAYKISKRFGISDNEFCKYLKSFQGVKGRVQAVENDKNIKVYVDFAHTPNALENVLKNLKKDLSKNARLISLFGCAAERDVFKRPIMGDISTKIADISIFTEDDPRFEDTNKNLQQIEKGVDKNIAKIISNPKILPKGKKHLYIKIPKRQEAIDYAVKIARKGDTIALCSKGHEESIAIKGLEHPWSEYDVAKTSLNTKGNYCAIILAAGKGTRMGSDVPKVLNELAGKPMILYSLMNLRKAGFGKIILVVGHKKDQVINEIGPAVEYAVQKEQLGTGHAAYQGVKIVPNNINDVLILNGDDSAFYTSKTIKSLYENHISTNSVVSFLSLVLDDATGLGRVVRDKKGSVLSIVEEKDALPMQKKIKEANIGIYVFKRDWFLKNVSNIKKSSSGEYYIVDLVKIAINQKQKVSVVKLKNAQEWYGVNTPQQLNISDQKMREIVNDR